MSQIFNEDGKVVPVTLIEAGPITITQLKTKEKDGYSAIQVGFETKTKGGFKNLREFRIDKEDEYKEGDVIDVSSFNEKDKVAVSGVSRGHGFAGAMKRHNFKGMPASHGHKAVKRHVGSIGQRFPQRTLKGMRMAGHMGNANATIKNLTVAVVDKEKNMLLIRGAVPGVKGALLIVKGS